jgi:glycosyltransferase involved in cell wall biosynthesis
VVICFTTPPFIAFIGVLLKWLKGYRLVYWTMDLYPDVVAAAGLMRRGGLTWRLLQRIDQLCLRTSDRVVVLGSCMKEIILAKGAHADRIETISVWSGTESFRDRPRELNPFRTLWGIGDRFTILYLGNFGLGHDMEAISGAVEMLRMTKTSSGSSSEWARQNQPSKSAFDSAVQRMSLYLDSNRAINFPIYLTWEMHTLCRSCLAGKA